MLTQPEFKKPWFSIVSVREKSGRSMADIAREICAEYGVTLAQVRGSRGFRRIVEARKAIITKVYDERPDLSSSQIAVFLCCDGSTVRHLWRDLRVLEAA